MSAIISDKFRIYNAEQFLGALGDFFYDSEGNPVNFDGDNPADAVADVERNRMYFFVGRPQEWYATLETYSRVDGSATPGERWEDVVSGSTITTGSGFTGEVVAVYEDAILLRAIGPADTSTPVLGETITIAGAGVGSTAAAGIYRYATENTVPLAYDNDREYFGVYDDIIAAKRMTTAFTRGVIRRYNWPITSVGNDRVYDMYKNDYSPESLPDGVVGKLGSSTVDYRGEDVGNQSSLGNMKFYVMNGVYEVFKCIYNGSSGANPDGIAATVEPTRSPSGNAVYRNVSDPTDNDGLFFENLGGAVISPGTVPCDPARGYVWKYMFKLPVDDVLRFLSTDFMPIPTRSFGTLESERLVVESRAVDGAIESVILEDASSTLADSSSLPGGRYFAPILGDGTGGVVSFAVDVAGVVSDLIIEQKGLGYTYASISTESGTTYDGTDVGLWQDVALSGGLGSAVGVEQSGAAFEFIISPKGGHGSPGNGGIEREFNTKRVMANIRLTYAEGSGDFPVDNDFRRIGILKDPDQASGGGAAVLSTLNNLKKIRVTPAINETPAVDVEFTQVRSTGGTAKGRIVSYESLGATDGIISYYQSAEEHTDKGVVRAFEGGAAAPTLSVPGLPSPVGVNNFTGTAGTGDIAFTDGLADTEFVPDTGDILYLENRRLITRAPDQIEDIKLVIEF